MALRLMPYAASIVYRRGLENSNADGLSHQAWSALDEVDNPSTVTDSRDTQLQSKHGGLWGCPKGCIRTLIDCSSSFICLLFFICFVFLQSSICIVWNVRVIMLE